MGNNIERMGPPFLVSVAGAALLLCAPAQVPRDLEQRIRVADREITRLAPSAFPRLPENLAQDVRRRGCTIPQPFSARQPRNVIKGQFSRPGQVDWAVLCSVKGRSSILVIWNGSPTNPASIAPASDEQFVQGIGQGKFGFSRAIAGVGRSYILAHATAGGPKPPPIDHQGIDDAFIEKASVVHYFHRGRWLGLCGAD